MPSRPPGEPAETSAAGAPAARPRYLALALVVALFFGAGCWTEGCARLQYYRDGQDGGQVLNERVADDDQRAEVTRLYERHHEVAEELRSRARDALLTDALAVEEVLEQNKPDDDLLQLEGMDDRLAYVLAERGVTSIDDLADLATVDLMDIDQMSEERAGALILAARAPEIERLESQQD